MSIKLKLTIFCILALIISHAALYLWALEIIATPSLTMSSFILIALSVGFILVIINVITEPIQKLSDAADELQKGNLDISIEIKSNDEIGKVATLLKETASNLNKQVREEKALSDQLTQQKAALEKQKSELEKVHEEITSSIDYAKRIQHSMLPTPAELKRNVSDSFIFFKPKDVVSGDFYWFEKVRRGRNEYLIVACADCTGHGVPGAIMSMMGGNQLTSIIYYQNYIEPVKILARLDKAIKFELYRDEDSAQKRDGMEIMVCVIDLDSLELKFAGAGIPLLHQNKEGITIHKSPKLMVGGVEGDDEKEVEDQFELQTIQLQDGDRIYLSSDGFQDQFGGPDDKRFMARTFRNLIERTSIGKMKDQGEKIEEAFENWKGNQEQTDDILVMGLKV